VKEIKNRILEDFLAKNNQRCHERFTGTVFQDICGRVFVNSAYSRFLNDHGSGMDNRTADQKRTDKDAL
jgi:hypothetical protein